MAITKLETEKEKQAFAIGLAISSDFVGSVSGIGGGSYTVNGLTPNLCRCVEEPRIFEKYYSEWIKRRSAKCIEGTLNYTYEGNFVALEWLPNYMRSLLTRSGASCAIENYIVDRAIGGVNGKCLGVTCHFAQSSIRMFVFCTVGQAGPIHNIVNEGFRLDMSRLSNLGEGRGDVYAEILGGYTDDLFTLGRCETAEYTSDMSHRLQWQYGYFKNVPKHTFLFIGALALAAIDDLVGIYSSGWKWYRKGRGPQGLFLNKGFAPTQLNNLFYGFMVSAYDNDLFTNAKGIAMTRPYIADKITSGSNTTYGAPYYPQSLGQLIVCRNSEWQIVTDLITGVNWFIWKSSYAFLVISSW